MRRLVLAFALVAGSAAAEEFALPMPVVSAEVFPAGALVVQGGHVDVPAGAHKVQVLLPAEVLREGRPAVTGAVLTGVSVAENAGFDPERFDGPGVTAARAAVSAAEAALREAEADVAAVEAALTALDAREQFVRSMRAGMDLPSTELLVALSAALGTELAAISDERRGLEAQLPDLERASARADAALARAEAGLRAAGPAAENWQVMTLDVVAAEAGRVDVGLVRFSPAARWSIDYELRLREADAVVEVGRFVTVEQAGPLPWRDAAVTLSTAEPFAALSATEVRRSIARIAEALPVATMRSGAMAEAVMMEADALGVAKVDADGAVIRYLLPSAVTLAPGAAVQVRLDALELEAEAYLAGSPRFDETAFVMADVVNGSGEPILPGAAQMYRGEMLIGAGNLPRVAAGGEVTLGFGPERSVALEVAFLDQQEGDRGIIRGQETREDRVRLLARNLGNVARDVRLRYAVPTSQQEDLKVRVDMSPTPDMRDVDDLLGVMEWRLALAPGAEQAIELEFDLRWPEGEVLNWRP